MARGRRPKPVELKDADGNPGRRPLPARIETEKQLEETPPPMLGPAGAELWRELVEQLSPSGALSSVDRAGLTALCLQWDRAMEAAAVLEEQGHYTRGSMGQLVEHPALKIEARAHAAVLRFAGEYAATPVARARVAAAKALRQQQLEFEQLSAGEVIDIEDVEELDDGDL